MENKNDPSLVQIDDDLPNFRVEFRPLTFVEDRLRTVHAIKKAIYASRVSRRGWPFPFIRTDESNIRPDEGFLEGGWDSGDQIERWRLYRSGQFVFKSNIREFKFPALHCPKHDGPDNAIGVISYGNWVYNFTEFFEFAHRLGSVLDLEETPLLSVTISKMYGATVGTWGNEGVYLTPSVSLQDKILIESELPVPQTVQSYDSEARGKFIEFMGYFDVVTSDQTVLRVQNELLSMRLGRDVPRSFQVAED